MPATDRFRNGPLSLYGADNPRTTGMMNVADATRAGYRVMPWLPSSGAGPGSRGYQGSGHISGYSGINQGTGDDYIRRNGGLSAPRPSLLNEHYLNQPGVTMGAWDRQQSQRHMDQSDPIGGFFADQMGVAHGQGAHDKADFFRAMLQDHLAQRQSSSTSTGGMTVRHNPDGSVDYAPEWNDAPPPAATMSTGAQHSWDQAPYQSPTPSFAEAYQMRQDAAQPQTMAEAGANVGDEILHTPFGDASETVGAPGGPSRFTVDNGQGSGLGGVNFPGRQGRQNAGDFFQDAANRQGPNRFAVPEPGFGGTRAAAGFGERSLGNSKLWSAYDSAMKARRLLGKK